MKKLQLVFCAVVAFALQSCSVEMDTSYLKDSATSMEMKTMVDPAISAMLTQDSGSKKNLTDMKGLSENWKSAYEIQQDSDKKKLTKDPDSVRLMKKMFLKYIKKDGEISGFGFKYDHLLQSELASLMKSAKKNKNIDELVGKWNGKSLTLNMAELSPEAMMSGVTGEKDAQNPTSKKDSLNASAKKMTDGMMDMLKMFKISFANKLHFENKIKSISGKNDMVRKIDDNTVEVKYSSEDFLDGKKKINNSDKKIIITTE